MYSSAAALPLKAFICAFYAALLILMFNYCEFPHLVQNFACSGIVFPQTRQSFIVLALWPESVDLRLAGVSIVESTCSWGLGIVNWSVLGIWLSSVNLLLPVVPCKDVEEELGPTFPGCLVDDDFCCNT